MSLTEEEVWGTPAPLPIQWRPIYEGELRPWDWDKLKILVQYEGGPEVIREIPAPSAASQP
jgi:hypothetical protein